MDDFKQWLDRDLDEWTRHVVARHFDPETGSPYWLGRAAGLAFDPRDITRYDQLLELGPFTLVDLRTVDPADLVPQAVPRPLAGRVFESGGTTGDPCRVFYTDAMHRHRTLWRRWGLENTGFERGRSWLHATPSGPHVIGSGMADLADHFDSVVYAVDIDPRWVKDLVREGRLPEADAYTRHVVDQMRNIVEQQAIDYLTTTSVLFRAFAQALPESARRLKGVWLGGTEITPDMYESFTTILGDGVIGRTYGNTFGNAIGLPASSDGRILPYIPQYPQVTMAVIDRGEWRRTVEYGAIGRVRLTVLHEDLLLPNILERDQAMRYDTGAEWPCDGVANVRRLQVTHTAPEGIY